MNEHARPDTIQQLFQEAVPTSDAADFIYGLIHNKVISPVSVNYPRILERKISDQLASHPNETYTNQPELITKLCDIFEVLVTGGIDSLIISQMLLVYCQTKSTDAKV